jgi:hypothetical protein
MRLATSRASRSASHPLGVNSKTRGRRAPSAEAPPSIESAAFLESDRRHQDGGDSDPSVCDAGPACMPSIGEFRVTDGMWLWAVSTPGYGVMEPSDTGSPSLATDT